MIQPSDNPLILTASAEVCAYDAPRRVPSLAPQVDLSEGTVWAFDKPLGQTSFQMLAGIRKALSLAAGIPKVKIGHAGTLDPLATGVLILCTGRMTKQIDRLQAAPKEYVAQLQLGATTPSFDLEQPVDAQFPTAHITEDFIRATLPSFIGTIEQIPPRFSAVKVEGRRAYDLARRGADVPLKPKILTISALDLLHFSPDTMRLDLRVRCSKGTYIRALARDLGEALRTGAHLTALRRTRVGDFAVEEAFSPTDFISLIPTAHFAPRG